MSDDKKNKNGKGEDKTLKALIALAGFAIGATSIVAWNNRKAIQGKALDAKERAVELKEKTIELTETVRKKLTELNEKRDSTYLSSSNEVSEKKSIDNVQDTNTENPTNPEDNNI